MVHKILINIETIFWNISKKTLNHDAKIGFVLNDFTNLMHDELRLLIKLKYDKYIEYYTWRNVCFVQQAKSGQLTSNLLF